MRSLSRSALASAGGGISKEPQRSAPVSAPEAAARLPVGGASRALPSESIDNNRKLPEP